MQKNNSGRNSFFFVRASPARRAPGSPRTGQPRRPRPDRRGQPVRLAVLSCPSVVHGSTRLRSSMMRAIRQDRGRGEMRHSCDTEAHATHARTQKSVQHVQCSVVCSRNARIHAQTGQTRKHRITAATAGRATPTEFSRSPPFFWGEPPTRNVNKQAPCALLRARHCSSHSRQ